uniref:Uncharacterized protein n=1 Tax=Caenorhabditis tropicalis TaxID=1561998 RepID=A0A1I7T159_9PELO
MKCDEEQKKYETVFQEDEFNLTLWLAVSCVILFAIVILLCVYVYWLRSSFVAVDERNLPEYETEASLFIAKQRSFPTSYQDPALLDISVDRWN